MRLRKHQEAVNNHIEDVISGSESLSRTIISDVTPGGGKSAIGQIVSRLVSKNIIDAVCIVVPRKSLAKQAACDFLDEGMRSLLSHSNSVNEATNIINPCRGTEGYVTTYQGLAADKGAINNYEFMRKDYALVLDEAHHLSEGGSWHQSIQPLYDNAKFVLIMTGTLYRADLQPIAFIPYRDTGTEIVVDRTSSTHKFIEYYRKDALAEKAIIPIEFYQVDGWVNWIESDGSAGTVTSLVDADDASVRKAIFTSVRTGLAKQIIDQTLNHYLAHRKKYPGAKLLCVSDSIASAKQHKGYLESLGVVCDIAVSDDSKLAQKAIDDFRFGALSALITVAMAYEGLDVPGISHISCLTNIRSRPWIEQVFGRATRFDRRSGVPYDEQKAFIFTPDDRLINDVIDQIRLDQDQFISASSSTLSGVSSSVPSVNAGEIIPIGSTMTGVRVSELGENCLSLTVGQTQGINEFKDANGITDVSPLNVAKILLSLGHELPDVAANDPVISRPITPQERSEALRRKIENKCRQYAIENGIEPQVVNSVVKKQFKNKSRKDMICAELLAVWEWVDRHFKVKEFERHEEAV